MYSLLEGDEWLMSVYVGWFCWLADGTLVYCCEICIPPWLTIVLKSCIILNSCCRSCSLSSFSCWMRCFSNSSHCCWIEVVSVTFSSCCPVRTSLKLSTADSNLLGLWRVVRFFGHSVAMQMGYIKRIAWFSVLKFIILFSV